MAGTGGLTMKTDELKMAKFLLKKVDKDVGVVAVLP